MSNTIDNNTIVGTEDNTIVGTEDSSQDTTKCLSDTSQLMKTIDNDVQLLKAEVDTFEKNKEAIFGRGYDSQKLKEMRDDLKTLLDWKTEIENLEYIIVTTLHPDVCSDQSRKAIETSPELKKLKELVAFIPNLKSRNF